MPSLQPTVSRRRVLVGAAALALLGASATACAVTATATGRRRTGRATRAGPRRQPAGTDAAAAARAADRAGADDGGRRAVRARPGAVRRDLVRMTGKDAPTSATSEPTSTTGRARQRPPTPEDVIGALRESADSAARSGRQAVGLPRGAARLDRRVVHRGIHRRTGTAGTTAMTSPTPTPTPAPSSRPSDAADGALFDAIATEHGDHLRLRDRVRAFDARGQLSGVVVDGRAPRAARRGVRDAERALGRPPRCPRPAISCRSRSTTRPMRPSSRCGWRRTPPSRGAPSLEQANNEQDRAFAVAALTECAVTAARWRRVLGVTPITVAFPGGSE